MKEKFLLIDGNSLINRAYFALPIMSTPDGTPSQAVYGFCTMLLRAIGEYKPTRIAVAFDLPAPTFRHAEYKEYKATRKGMDGDLAVQVPVLKRLLLDMCIKTVEMEGFEADDLIGTLSDCECQTIIVTGDRDAFQLIDGCTNVAYTKKGISGIALYDEQAFIAEYGFSPSCLVDFKALFGDTSDNIPGVKGIGEKTASSLIKEYKNLENIYENLSALPEGVAKKLTEGKDNAHLSRRLATIERKVPIALKDVDCAFSMPFSAGVRNSFLRLGFKSLAVRNELFAINETNESKPETVRPALFCAAPPVVAVKDFGGVLAAIHKIKTAGFFAVAVDGDKIMLASHDMNVNIKIKTNLLDDGADYDKVLNVLTPLLISRDIEKAVFDLKALMKKFPPSVRFSNCFDVKLAAYLTDFDTRPEDIGGLCALYNHKDGDPAFALLQAAKDQKAKLQELNLNKLYYDLELPLVEILFGMEQRGFRLDLDLCNKIGLELSAKIGEISRQIYDDCGHEFNINSPKQLGVVLFEEMKLPYPKKSKNYSTAFEILDLLRFRYPVCDHVLAYRQATKLLGTYVEGLKKLVGSDCRVHTDFKQAMTATGRLSSVEPNLQNIPIREDDGKKLRGMFVADNGYLLVSADYSQIELRLLAHLSGDSVMTDAFINGDDIHAQTAAKVFNVPLSEVTREMRQSAKAVNFGIVYGISDFGLAESLKISVGAAADLIERYFERFSGVKKYLDDSVKEAKERGFARTVMGRIRKIPELKSPVYQVRKFGERVAMNMPVQGSAADIIKAAMIAAYPRLKEIGAHLILQVHDELIAEVPENKAGEAKEILKNSMESAIKLSVPLVVSVGEGKNWLECKT